MSIWTYIKADSFFRDYLPEIKNYHRKIKGINTKGNPTSFSPEEYKKITQALYRMVRDKK